MATKKWIHLWNVVIFYIYIYIYIVNVYQRAKGSHWDFSWGSYWNWLGCLGIDEDLQYTEVSQHRKSITDRFRFLCHVREANTKGQVSWVTNNHKSVTSSINAINHDKNNHKSSWITSAIYQHKAWVFLLKSIKKITSQGIKSAAKGLRVLGRLAFLMGCRFSTFTLISAGPASPWNRGDRLDPAIGNSDGNGKRC